MPASITIVTAVIIGAVLIALAVLRWPIYALVSWVIASVVLHEYVLFPDASALRVQLSQLLLAGLLLGFGIRWILRFAPSVTPGRPELLMAAFITWAVIAGFMTGTLFVEEGARTISILLNGFAIPVLILYLTRFPRQPLATMRTASTILTVFLGYLIVTAFCEHFHLNWLVFPQYILDPSYGTHSERARGPVLNAAENGGIIAILLIVALHRIGYAFTFPLRWWATSVLLITGLPALWFTQTRGAWVAFGGGLVIMLLHERRKGVVTALLSVSVIAVLLITFLRIDVVPPRPETTEFRLGLYMESMSAFQKHPLTGWGLGTFTSFEHLYGDFGRSSSLAEGVQHDTTVAIATETGALGAILYISFLIVLFRSLVRLRKSARSCEKRDFYAVCLAALTIFVINGTFADSRYLMSQNALAFLIAGLGLAIRPDERLNPRLVVEQAAVTRQNVLAV